METKIFIEFKFLRKCLIFKCKYNYEFSVNYFISIDYT